MQVTELFERRSEESDSGYIYRIQSFIKTPEERAWYFATEPLGAKLDRIIELLEAQGKDCE